MRKLIVVAAVPQRLIDSLQGIPGFDEGAFREVHQSDAQVTSIRINPAKWQQENSEAIVQKLTESPVPWSQYGYFLARRPSFTFDPLFHAGCYYVQEASSMFLEQALVQTTDLSQPLTVLDLCAAPGGKSTHLQSLLSADSLLVSNDVIRTRAAVLKENIIKWGYKNAVVTNNDPQHFSRLESFFDVIVVDAPCSGSGLFRRDPDAIDEWSEANVQMCCGRQKRILSDVLPSLKEGGLLIYSTCSYSREEDEDIADWLVGSLGMANRKLRLEDHWHVVESVSEKMGATGYRFFPDKVKGEGFYMAVFQKLTTTKEPRLKEARLERATAAEASIVRKWLNDDSLEMFRTPYLYGVLKKLMPRYAVIKNALNVQYAGVAIGNVMKEKLVPEHALALSGLLSPSVPATSLDYDTAIQYLQRNELVMNANAKGWQLVRYAGHNIGWINALPNRINNYYPKEWRILKNRNDAGFEK